jgi:hypothetical protein
MLGMVTLSTIGFLATHKWKTLIGASVVGYSGYKIAKVVYGVKRGWSEFQKISELIDINRMDLPEDERPEEGSNEELDFMNKLFENVSKLLFREMHTNLKNVTLI